MSAQVSSTAPGSRLYGNNLEERAYHFWSSQVPLQLRTTLIPAPSGPTPHEQQQQDALMRSQEDTSRDDQDRCVIYPMSVHEVTSSIATGAWWSVNRNRSYS